MAFTLDASLDSGKTWITIAENKKNSESAKALSTKMHRDTTNIDRGRFMYRVYDAGELLYVSSNNNDCWRMKWKYAHLI